MLSEKLRLSLICILVTLVSAGIASQMGLLTGPIANAYNIEVTSAAAMFSTLTSGILLGTFSAYFLLDYIRIRSLLLACCFIVIACTLGILFIKVYFFLPIFLGVIGLITGINICIIGIIIGKVWHGKQRETFFVGLDASYNVGAIVVTLVTTYILSRHMPWELSVLFVVLITVVIVFLSFVSRFDIEKIPQDQEVSHSKPKVEWNSGIIVAGISLFLVMYGKYSVVLWLPQYAETALSLGKEESGRAISSIYSTALIGCLAGMYIISKIRIIYFISAALLLGVLGSLLFVYANSFSSLVIIAGAYGFAVSILFNVHLVYGLNYTSHPSHKHVSYVMFSSGVSGAVAPYVSSMFVEWFGGPVAGLYGASIAYSLSFFLLIMHEMFGPGSKISPVNVNA